MSVTELKDRQRNDGSIMLDDGDEAMRDFEAEHGGFRHSPGLWEGGIDCDACGIDPSQIPEAMDHARRNGFRPDQVNFDSDGRCHMDSRKTRKAYLKTIGMYDRNGGYGD
jgi:hypothetical protein